MNNLEKEIIKRLNKVLNKYNLEIISRYNFSYKTMNDPYNIVTKHSINECILVEIKDNNIIDCYFTWDNIKNMVLAHFLNYSLFDAINDSYDITKYFNSYPNTTYDKHYILMAKLYNEFITLNNCSSYEEIIIKMDLMGI